MNIEMTQEEANIIESLLKTSTSAKLHALSIKLFGFYVNGMRFRVYDDRITLINYDMPLKDFIRVLEMAMLRDTTPFLREWKVQEECSPLKYHGTLFSFENIDELLRRLRCT